MNPKILGRHIIADPNICHGRPTFRGTRIMVSQVLDQIAKGMAWETIIEEWNYKVSRDAIAEAVRLANTAFIDHVDDYVLEPTPA